MWEGTHYLALAVKFPCKVRKIQAHSCDESKLLYLELGGASQESTGR